MTDPVDPVLPEDLCERCGICCFEKFYLDDGRLLITDVPCEYLDPETRLCRIYGTRIWKNKRCLTAAKAKAMGVLPATCPYVRNDPDYQPPLLLSEHPEYEKLVRELFEELQ